MTLSPARQELLKSIVTIQEQMLHGVTKIISGLRQSSDPEVVFVCEQAHEALEHNRAVMDAMIDGLNATQH